MRNTADHIKNWIKLFTPPIMLNFFYNMLRKSKNQVYSPFNNCIINHDIRVIFDIGANIGDVSIAAYKSFPKAKIFSFEPVSSTYAALNQNILNYKDRIKPYKLGFFNCTEKIQIHITSFHGANSIIDQSQDHKTVHANIDLKEIGLEEIEVVTLDSFVESSNITRIDIIKIDVEGVEKEVILGGINTFRNKVDMVFIELSLLRRGRDSTYWIEICQLLYELGFILSNIYDIAKYEENNKEFIGQFDAVFARDK